MTAPAIRPDAAEYPSFYAKYVALVPDDSVVHVLQRSGEEIVAALSAVPEARGGHAYAEGKWSIRTLVGHMIDAERIFTYRALRLGRGDSTPLPGFDENTFAVAAHSDDRTLASLIDEFNVVRAGTVRLFASFPTDAWMRSGTVNNGGVSVRALGYITAGHAMHHLRILQERYGV